MKKRIISLTAALIMIISLMPGSMTAFAVDSVIECLMATVNQTTVLISWKNPSSGNIDSVQVFDENGNEVTLATEPSKNNGEITSTKVEGLTGGKEYTYTVALNMDGGSSFKQDINFTTGVNYQWDSQNGIKMYDLAKVRIEQGSSLLPFYLEITEDAAHSGSSGIHAISNYTGWVNLKFEPIALDSSKNYRASVWAKAKNISREVWLCSDNTGRVKIDNNGDWKKYSFNISGVGSFIMNLQAAMTTFDDLWADDFAVYELDADGNEVGNNLIGNGGFEHTVYDYNITDGVLSWKEPENSTYTGVDIYYRDFDGNKIKLNDVKIQKGTTEFTIPAEYQTDESHDLLFVNYINETETPARAFSILGKADYYKTVLTQSGSEIAELVPGVVTVTRAMRNNSLGEDVSVTLMLGLYKDGELLSLRYKSSIIPQNGIKTNISDNITIPDDGSKYELRAFLWDAPTEMNILKGADVFQMN